MAAVRSSGKCVFVGILSLILTGERKRVARLVVLPCPKILKAAVFNFLNVFCVFRAENEHKICET